MAITLNDNIRINAGKPSESKYLNASNEPYGSMSAVTTSIGIAERHLGLTVLMNTGGTNTEYWWKTGVLDTDLIEKKFSSEQVIGDFITGATNLGFFSGTTAVQALTLSGFPSSPVDFDVTYYSEYNWYYVDSDGVIRIGTPTYGGVLRRAYVDSTRTKSWIYSVQYDGWVLANIDVTENVGSSISSYGYAGSPYINAEWSVGFNTNGSTSVDVVGVLSTGDTYTVANPMYRDKSNQELHMRSILNETPELINITYDENYVRFSGASAVVTANNYGGGSEVFSGKSSTEMKFRTLVPSGDTSIVTSGDELIIFSSSNGSANSITGVTNAGSGATIYSGTTERNVQLRTLVGSGGTTVTESGNELIINSTGTDFVFDEDIVVSIDDGKSFGKYVNGDTIPASGKTAAEVIILACFEAKVPTASLTSSGNNVAFGESSKVVNLSFSYIINSLGASVDTVSLEWRRGNTGSWVQLTSDTGATTYVHNIDDSGDRFNTSLLNYRYIVTDTEGMSITVTHNVTPQTYAAPTISSTINGNVTSPETQTYREKGNVNSSPYGSISSNRSLVNITAWQLERSYDGGSWTTINSGTGLSDLSISIPITPDTSIPTSANSVQYRITYVDEYTTGTGGAQFISFGYFNYVGVSTNTVLNATQIIALGNVAFATSTSRTYTYTTSGTEYAYYAYPSTYADLSNITMLDNGAGSPIPIFGAFQKLSNVIITNDYGIVQTYKVYRSNAPGAFSTDVVTFS